jgi:allantoicase
MSQFIPSHIIAYSNSDFTNPHEVVLPDDPKDCTDNYTHMGVKYWGLETKRHKATTIEEGNKKIYYNHEAHHWLKIGFKYRTEIKSLRVSTKWFTGNQVRAISVLLIDELTGGEQEVLSKKILQPDQEHHFLFEATTATECLIKMYYEGGISRINFFGEKTEAQLVLGSRLFFIWSNPFLLKKSWWTLICIA